MDIELFVKYEPERFFEDEHGRNHEINGSVKCGYFVSNDSIRFDNVEEYDKYINGKFAHNYLDDTVKKGDNEELLYAIDRSKVMWFNLGTAKEQTGPRYAILQLAEGNEQSHYNRGVSLDFLISHGKNPNCDDYEMIYFKSVDGGSKIDLEEIFSELNSNLPRPDNYYGTSLSVSDVVLVSENGKDVKAYYCDTYGFTPLDNFISDEIKWKFSYGLDVREEYSILSKLYSENLFPPQALYDRIDYLNSAYSPIFKLADIRKDKYIEINGTNCSKLDEWNNGTGSYVLGCDIQDNSFFYAQVFDCHEQWKGIYNYEYDHKPTRSEVEEDHLNRIVEIDIDKHEEKYGADGSHNFPNLNNEPVENMSLDERYIKAMEMAGYKFIHTEKDSMATVSFENISTGEYIGFDGFELIGSFLDDIYQNNNFKDESEKQLFSELINSSATKDAAEHMLYTVTITEVLQRDVSVNANSLEEAREMVEKMYCNCEIVLDAEDIKDRSFDVSDDSCFLKRKSR